MSLWWLRDWLLLAPPILLLAGFLVGRYMGWLPKPRSLPGRVAVGNRVSHRAEAILLLCVTLSILVFTATNASTGGRLLRLAELHPAFARVNLLVALGAALGVSVAVLLALAWRTSTGVIVAAGVLITYGVVLNGPDYIMESLVPEDATEPQTLWRFALSTPDVDGAQLYVNGVHLGTLPYETTLDEFLRAVPVWEDKPSEMEQSGWLRVPSLWYPNTEHFSTESYLPYARIQIDDVTYYFRVKMGDRWGYASDSSGALLNRSERGTSTRFLAFFFPERKQQIERLLDIARLSDYAPDEAWYAAMETYRSDGWRAVIRATEQEPRMSEVLDEWATWKYDLDRVNDSESAWKVFDQIRGEADQCQYYVTNDVAGRAVELLAPKLDPKRLVRLACHIVRSTEIYSWGAWQMNGRPQFGFSANPGGFFTGAELVTNYSAGGRGFQWVSAGDFAVAHAVWILDAKLDAIDDSHPNVIERDLVPVFVAQHYNQVNLLQLAAKIGGPVIGRYLLRQNWRANPRDLPWGQQMGSGPDDVNGWLYLLANLRSPDGRQFREENYFALKRMADGLTDNMFGTFWKRLFGFVFLDLDLGPESFAMQYWPRFRDAAASKPYDALSLQYEYLLHMEPLSTVDMYVECWKASRGDTSSFEMALRNFADFSVPYEKRARIHAALVQCVENDVSNVDMRRERDEPSARRMLISDLDSELTPITDEARAGDILAKLRAGSPGFTPENVANWLAHSAPSHLLIGMLANATEPSLRLVVMDAIREHPTPANRAILDKLLTDDNEQVRQAAQAVAAELETLKATLVEGASTR